MNNQPNFDITQAAELYQDLRKSDMLRSFTNHILIGVGVPTILLNSINHFIPLWLMLIGVIIGLQVIKRLERDVADRLFNYLTYTKQPLPEWLERDTFFTRPTTVRKPSAYLYINNEETDEYTHQ